jgi:succinate-acetate transporter protein
MVVSNSYCGVFCVVCLRLVYGGVHQLLCCVFCFVSLRLVYGGVEDKQNKTHNAIAVGHHHTQDEEKVYGGVLHILYYVFCFVLVMCMVVSYTYCIVFFVLLKNTIQYV